MKVVPKKKRLAIYKRVLKNIDKDEASNGLCYRLRDQTNGLYWYWVDTPTYFPEFGTYFKSVPLVGEPLKKKTLYKRNKRQWRIKVLTEIINKMEKK